MSYNYEFKKNDNVLFEKVREETLKKKKVKPSFLSKKKLTAQQIIDLV